MHFILIFVKFRSLTGINTPVLLMIVDPPRPARNLGIYARGDADQKLVIREWSTICEICCLLTSHAFQLMSTIINVVFLGQIVVAAARTALRASDAFHIAIAVRGSINTRSQAYKPTFRDKASQID